MGAAESNSPVPVSGADFFSQQAKAQQYQSRRPQITSAAQLLGPGFGPFAVPTTNWNADICTYSGSFSMVAPTSSANATAVNAPADADTTDMPGLVGLIGTVVSDSVFGGRQILEPVGIGTVAGFYWERQFIRSPLDPTTITWGAWKEYDPVVPMMQNYAGETSTINNASFDNLFNSSFASGKYRNSSNATKYFDPGNGTIKLIKFLKTGVYHADLNIEAGAAVGSTGLLITVTYPVPDNTSDQSLPVAGISQSFQMPGRVLNIPLTIGVGAVNKTLTVGVTNSSGAAVNLTYFPTLVYLGPLS